MRYCESPYFYQRRKSARSSLATLPKAHHRRGRPSGGETVDAHLRHDGHGDVRDADARTSRSRLPARPHHRADGQGAANLRNIVEELRARGCHVPIVADIHFKPEAAMEAAQWVEVVRINPGNYADKKKFAVKEYTDEEYASELKRIEEQFTPLVKRCKELKRAMRIAPTTVRAQRPHYEPLRRHAAGHGGKARLEFARICRQHDSTTSSSR